MGRKNEEQEGKRRYSMARRGMRVQSACTVYIGSTHRIAKSGLAQSSIDVLSMKSYGQKKIYSKMIGLVSSPLWMTLPHTPSAMSTS